MRLSGWLKYVCCGCLLIATCTQMFAAEDDKAREEEESPPAQVLKEKPPVYEPPALKPLKPLAPAPQLVSEKKAQTPAKAKQKKADQQADKPAPPQRKPFRQPTPLQLENIGANTYLTPAMKWHLQRAGIVVQSQTLASSASTYQGEQKFYPGVSRLPEQKPFDGLEPAPNAFDRYWPLLLEGRQDPNTGFILWRLP